MRTLISRLTAFMVDWLVLFAVLAAPQFAIMTLTGSWFLDQDSSPVASWAWVGISVTLPSLAYFVLSDHTPRGQTFGKQVMKIGVRSDDAFRLTWSQALVRNIVKLIPWELTHIMIFFPEPFSEDDPSSGKLALMMLSSIAFVLWLVAPFFDRPSFRALHDRVAGTRVQRV